VSSKIIYANITKLVAIFKYLLYYNICIKLGKKGKNGRTKNEKILSIVAIFLILMLAIITPVYAANEKINDNGEVLESDNASDFYKTKEQALGKIEQYSEKYGSKAYGITAMVLDTVRIYSIPLCFLGISVGAIYQYIIGIRRLDIRDRGFNLIIAFVTILVIAQVLPLVFTIVTRGWVL